MVPLLADAIERQVGRRILFDTKLLSMAKEKDRWPWAERKAHKNNVIFSGTFLVAIVLQPLLFMYCTAVLLAFLFRQDQGTCNVNVKPTKRCTIVVLGTAAFFEKSCCFGVHRRRRSRIHKMSSNQNVSVG